jgi:hypothetical protein
MLYGGNGRDSLGKLREEDLLMDDLIIAIRRRLKTKGVDLGESLHARSPVHFRI